MFQAFSRASKFCDRFRVLFFFLLLVVILRLPNFFEPYWYGDEGIYLTIGNALRAGSHLYRDIVDHKTPLIYYFAMVPNQFSFRVLNLVWMLVTTTLFYRLVKHFFEQKWVLLVVMFSFVFLTTVPRLEGNIPNGELFVMGFVLLAFNLFFQLPYLKAYFTDSLSSIKKLAVLPVFLVSAASGICFGLGTLTKVPGLFDMIAAGGLGWFVVTHLFFTHSLKKNWIVIRQVLTSWVGLGIGFFLPILFSILYFAARGSLKDYLNFGLLYNFHYAGNWQLSTTSAVLTFFFSLPGKAIVVAGVILLLTVLTKKISSQFQFLSAWFLVALFASLLSNRPYPHYFLQVVPASILVIAWGLQTLTQYFQRSHKKNLTFGPGKTAEFLFIALFIVMLGAVYKVIGVYFYPTTSYYTKFIKMATGQLSREQYENSFDALVADNRAASTILKASPEKQLFIWGTNPMLYAQTGKFPVGRFTVSFHIKDLGLIPETGRILQAQKPKFIVTMNDEKEPFPELKALLNQSYIANHQFDHYTLWMRQN